MGKGNSARVIQYPENTGEKKNARGLDNSGNIEGLYVACAKTHHGGLGYPVSRHHEINEVEQKGKRSGERRNDDKLLFQRLSPTATFPVKCQSSPAAFSL